MRVVDAFLLIAVATAWAFGPREDDMWSMRPRSIAREPMFASLDMEAGAPLMGNTADDINNNADGVQSNSFLSYVKKGMCPGLQATLTVLDTSIIFLLKVSLGYLAYQLAILGGAGCEVLLGVKKLASMLNDGKDRFCITPTCGPFNKPLDLFDSINSSKFNLSQYTKNEGEGTTSIQDVLASQKAAGGTFAELKAQTAQYKNNSATKLNNTVRNGSLDYGRDGGGDNGTWGSSTIVGIEAMATAKVKVCFELKTVDWDPMTCVSLAQSLKVSIDTWLQANIIKPTHLSILKASCLFGCEPDNSNDPLLKCDEDEDRRRGRALDGPDGEPRRGRNLAESTNPMFDAVHDVFWEKAIDLMHKHRRELANKENVEGTQAAREHLGELLQTQITAMAVADAAYDKLLDVLGRKLVEGNFAEAQDDKPTRNLKEEGVGDVECYDDLDGGFRGRCGPASELNLDKGPVPAAYPKTYPVGCGGSQKPVCTTDGECVAHDDTVFSKQDEYSHCLPKNVRGSTGAKGITPRTFTMGMKIEGSLDYFIKASYVTEKMYSADLLKMASGRSAPLGLKFTLPIFTGIAFSFAATLDLSVPLLMLAKFEGEAILQGNISVAELGGELVFAVMDGDENEAMEGAFTKHYPGQLCFHAMPQGKVSVSLSASLALHATLSLKAALVLGVWELGFGGKASFEAAVGFEAMACVGSKGACNFGIVTTNYVQFPGGPAQPVDSGLSLGVWAYASHPKLMLVFDFPGASLIESCTGWFPGYESKPAKALGDNMGPEHPDGMLARTAKRWQFSTGAGPDLSVHKCATMEASAPIFPLAPPRAPPPPSPPPRKGGTLSVGVLKIFGVREDGGNCEPYVVVYPEGRPEMRQTPEFIKKDEDSVDFQSEFTAYARKQQACTDKNNRLVAVWDGAQVETKKGWGSDSCAATAEGLLQKIPYCAGGNTCTRLNGYIYGDEPGYANTYDLWNPESDLGSDSRKWGGNSANGYEMWFEGVEEGSSFVVELWEWDDGYYEDHLGAKTFSAITTDKEGKGLKLKSAAGYGTVLLKTTFWPKEETKCVVGPELGYDNPPIAVYKDAKTGREHRRQIGGCLTGEFVDVMKKELTGEQALEFYGLAGHVGGKPTPMEGKPTSDVQAIACEAHAPDCGNDFPCYVGELQFPFTGTKGQMNTERAFPASACSKFVVDKK